MLVRTLRSVRSTDAGTAGLWCAAWVILVSACFGVVLEGPMGAVVFWTILGLASAAEDGPAIGDKAETVAHLPASQGAVGVAGAP
jgi:hypothetical protein